MTARLSGWVRRGLAVVVTAVLGLGGFLVYGARVVHPVTPADALRRYVDRPSYEGRIGVSGGPADERPAPGVYRYATSGSAWVDLLGIERRYPVTTTRVVRHGPGCQWEEEVPILHEHVETYSACAIGGDQVDTGLGTRLTYFFLPGRNDATCSPGGTRTGAGLAIGGSRRFRCLDARHRVRIDGTATFLGPRSVVVGGVTTACRQVRVLSVLSGSTSGAALREMCTDESTGLVLHETRAVGLTVETTLVGEVRYVETAEFTLLATAPRT